MRVFISWSGKRSEQVALLLHWWLKCVIQSSDPWVSSEDIESGSIWFNEISDQLASTTVGIICLTRENKDKPWILFETGALMKGLGKSRVCPLLIDLENQEVKPPLSQLNLSAISYEGVFKIVKAINNSLAEKALAITVLEQVFKTYWSQFDNEIKRILETTENVPVEVRAEGDILNEVLSAVRSFDRRIRNVEGAHQSGINYNSPDGQFYIIQFSESVKALDMIVALNSHLNWELKLSNAFYSTGAALNDNYTVIGWAKNGLQAAIVLQALRELGFLVESVTIK